MKTTIDLPDDLVRLAKVQAAESGTTLKELVVRGLYLVTGGDEEKKERSRQKRIKALLEQAKASNTEAMTPLRRDECHER